VALGGSEQVRLSFVLRVGDIATTVDVTVDAGGGALMTTSSSIGTVLPDVHVRELPTGDRNVLELLRGVGGAGPTENDIDGYFAGGRLSQVVVSRDGFNRFRRTLQSRDIFIHVYEFGYTWSRTIGLSDDDNNVNSRDPLNRNLDKSVLGYHRTHNLTSNGTYELPFGPSRAFLNTTPAWVSRIVEEWQLGGVFTWSSGTPLTLAAGSLTNIYQSATNTPMVLGKLPKGKVTKMSDGSLPNYFSTLRLGPAGSDPGRSTVTTTNSLEAAAIFAFFYSRLYFDSFSDSPHGEDIFKSRCAGCHGLKPNPTSKKSGPAVVTWGSIKDPIVLVGRMWNHSTDMLDQTLRQGRSWPRLSGQDTRDVLAYLWRLPEVQPVKSPFRFGDDVSGRSVFNTRCAQCHTLGGAKTGLVDLARPLRRATMLQLAASMWNHAPSMKQRNPGIKLPTLNETETRDLVTYLVVGRAFEETGDARRGERVFQAKQCASCHANGAKISGGSFDPVRMTSALWSHGPSMLAAMKRKNVRWPRFETAEMLDLPAYLNQ
jgi:mono/diheme cytochrome c family protein